MWPQRSTFRNTGPNLQLDASSQASSARTGQVSRRLPRLSPSSTPLPSWSVFDEGNRIRSPASVKRRCSRSMPTSSDRRSAGRPGQAAQAMLLADGGKPPVERGAGVQPGQRGEVGGDRGGGRRQRRAAGFGAPRAEMPPVGGVGPQRG